MGAADVDAGRDRPRWLRDWLELIRPFSFSASLVPVGVGAAVAWSHGHGNAGAFALSVLGVLLIQSGTNVINEVFDVARGVDTLDTPRASRVLVTGRLPSRRAHAVGLVLLALGALAGAAVSLVFHLGWVPFVLGLLGAVVGYAYTGPPFQLKYRGLGLPAEVLVMGPLMVLGAEYAQAGRCTWDGLMASLPVAFLVGTILVGNDLRDVESDREAGIRTVATLLGRAWAWRGYLVLLAVAFAALVGAVIGQALPWPALLAVLSAPMAVRKVRDCLRRSERMDRLDQDSAQLHLVFGLLLTLGLGMWGRFV